MRVTWSWLRATVWAAAFGAALAFVLTGPPSSADAVSDINGEAEAPSLRRIIDCLELTSQARSLTVETSDKQKLDAETTTAVADVVDEALTCTADAQMLIDAATGLQAETDPDFAFDSLDVAASLLTKLRKKLGRPQKAKSVRKALDKADGALLAAKLSMQGIFVEDKEKLSALQAGLPLDAYVEDFDRASVRALIKLLEPIDAGITVAGPAAKGPAAKKKAAKKKRSAKKGKRRKAAAKKKKSKKKKAKAKTPQRKRKATRKKAAKPSKVPADYYLAFAAESGKQTEGGFFILNFGRELRGPFVAAATIGVLDERRVDPTSQAFACIEVDVAGSDPLEFVALCARPTDSGLQVFATATGGQQLLQRLFGAALAADVELDYDGTDFRLSAKPEGAPDSEYVLVDTFRRPVGDDAWLLFVGGVGLTGTTEVGVDRVSVIPR